MPQVNKSYEQLLKRVQESLPQNLKDKGRFEIPKVLGKIQGNVTIISNFSQIAKDFGRDPQHFLKYILRELATPGKVNGQRLLIGTKISAVFLNKKIRQYALTYVLCKECGKPDTKLTGGEKGSSLIKCTACGAVSPVRRL